MKLPGRRNRRANGWQWAFVLVAFGFIAWNLFVGLTMGWDMLAQTYTDPGNALTDGTEPEAVRQVASDASMEARLEHLQERNAELVGVVDCLRESYPELPYITALYECGVGRYRTPEWHQYPPDGR